MASNTENVFIWWCYHDDDIQMKVFCTIFCILLWFGMEFPGVPFNKWFNSLRPSGTYMHQWKGTSLVQLMACRLSGVKPLSEPMLVYFQLEPYIEILIEIQTFLFKKMHLKRSSEKWRPFCLCLNVCEWRIYASLKLTIIGSDNGLSPGRRQAIIWTNAGILLIGPLGTNFSEILIGIQTF